MSLRHIQTRDTFTSLVAPLVAPIVSFKSLVGLLAAATIGFAPLAHADALQDIGKLMKQGSHAQALDKADQYLASKPKDPQARFLKGLILTEMNRTPEAIIVFTKLTEDYPESPEPYNNLAVIYAQQKQYEKAKQALEMAIRTHPSYATAHENLGDIYARMASQAYDTALQLDSSNSSAQTKLAMIRELMTATSRPAGSRPAAGRAAVAAKTEARQAAATANVIPATPIAELAETRTSANAANATEKEADSNPEVSKAVEAWAAAWSKKNVKGYLSYYAKDFKTPGGESREDWEDGRQKRIDKPGSIQVSIENLQVTMEGNDRARAKFRQHYNSTGFKTSGNKTLVMVKQGGKWLIQQELVK